jgi:hypothetical protein
MVRNTQRQVRGFLAILAAFAALVVLGLRIAGVVVITSGLDLVLITGFAFLAAILNPLRTDHECTPVGMPESKHDDLLNPANPASPLFKDR